MPKPYKSELLGEWVLIADDDEVFLPPSLPPELQSRSQQLSLLGASERDRGNVRADQPQQAWVVYRKREFALLRGLSDEDLLTVHRLKRVFGGQVVEVA